MVRVSSLDGEPVYEYEERSERTNRSRLSRRNPWPVFGGRRARSERSHHTHNDDVYSYATRRTATDLLYGLGGGSEHGTYSRPGGHITTRYNPARSFADDVYSTSQRTHRSHHSRRSRAWSRSQPSVARTLISHISRRRGSRATGGYADAPGSTRGSKYADENPQKIRREIDYNKRTYPRFVLPGWAHIVIGVFLIIVGIADIAWTASKYENDCDFTKDETYNPCAAENIYSYIAAPLWGGMIMMLVGSLPFLMTPYRLMYNGWMMFVLLAGNFFLLIAICPTILSLSILLIVENEDTFWANVPGKGIMLKDNLKFSLPIVMIILAFVDWLVCALSIVIGLCFPPQTEADFGLDARSGRSRKRRAYVEPAAVIEEDRRSRRSRRSHPLEVDPVIIEEDRRSRPSRRGHSVEPPIIIEEDRRSRHSRHNYPSDIPPLGGALVKYGDRRSEASHPRLERGERIVHEERIYPDGGRRSRDRSRGGSRYDDEIVSLGDSRVYSRDRRSYARSDDYRRGGRDYARSDRSRDVLTLY